MQLVELARLFRYLRQVLGDLVLHVEPARRQQVHLNHRIAVVFVGTRRHEPLPLLGHAPAVAEAIGAGPAIARLLLRVVRVGLAVGYEAIQLRQRGQASVVACCLQIRAIPPHAGLAILDEAISS